MKDNITHSTHTHTRLKLPRLFSRPPGFKGATPLKKTNISKQWSRLPSAAPEIPHPHPGHPATIELGELCVQVPGTMSRYIANLEVSRNIYYIYIVPLHCYTIVYSGLLFFSSVYNDISISLVFLVCVCDTCVCLFGGCCFETCHLSKSSTTTIL